jgi:hypothetical protein
MQFEDYGPLKGLGVKIGYKAGLLRGHVLEVETRATGIRKQGRKSKNIRG